MWTAVGKSEMLWFGVSAGSHQFNPFIEIKYYKKSMRNRIILLVLPQAINSVVHDNLEFTNIPNFLWRYFVATKDQRNGTAPLFVSFKNLTLGTLNPPTFHHG